MTKLQELYQQTDAIFLSKGENRTRVEQALENDGIIVPGFAGRCLHGA
jgi:hypothetical protein